MPGLPRWIEASGGRRTHPQQETKQINYLYSYITSRTHLSFSTFLSPTNITLESNFKILIRMEEDLERHRISLVPVGWPLFGIEAPNENDVLLGRGVCLIAILLIRRGASTTYRSVKLTSSTFLVVVLLYAGYNE